MKPINWESVELLARTPEGRPQVDLLLSKLREIQCLANKGLSEARRALDQAESAVQRWQLDVDSSTTRADQVQSDLDRVEQILRESTGERAL